MLLNVDVSEKRVKVNVVIVVTCMAQSDGGFDGEIHIIIVLFHCLEVFRDYDVEVNESSLRHINETVITGYNSSENDEHHHNGRLLELVRVGFSIAERGFPQILQKQR